MSEVIETKKAKKVRILRGARIICDPPNYINRWYRTEEARIQEMKSWVDKFTAFVRDHRSQDPVNMWVEKDEPDCCSACKADWEPVAGTEPHEIGKMFCAACGTEISND